MILQLQIRKFKNALNHMWKTILTENLLELNLEILLK